MTGMLESDGAAWGAVLAEGNEAAAPVAALLAGGTE